MPQETPPTRLLELAPAEIAIPLKVSLAGHTYRVRHFLRPPVPADWLAYEAALQMAIEELAPEPDSDEPGYRLVMRSPDAALDLWTRLASRVEGYALPAQEPPEARQGFSERSGDPAVLTGSPHANNAAHSASSSPGKAGQGFSPDINNAARSASSEGARGNPLSGFPETIDSDWRDLIPLAHKEAAARALTLVAPAQSLASHPGAKGFFPLRADEVPVRLEAAVGGLAYPRLLHRFRPPSVEAERTYRRLLAENLIVRGSRIPRTLIPARLPALVRLYDELILGVEGYAVRGQPLDSGEQAARHMDAWHKRIAVQALFGDVAESLPAAATQSPAALSPELPQ